MKDEEIDSFEFQRISRLVISGIQIMFVLENQKGAQSCVLYYIGAVYKG